MKFAEAASYVPGIGSTIGAVVGFLSSFTGDPQTPNPFQAPGPFAGGLYDPPNVWRPGKPGCAFQGLLWGYPVRAFDVKEHFRRGRGDELHWTFKDPRSEFEKATQDGKLKGKGLYERATVDVDLVPKHVGPLKTIFNNPPAAPVFYYAPVAGFDAWTAHRFASGRAWALENKKVPVLFGFPQWKGSMWADLATYRKWFATNKPGDLKARFNVYRTDAEAARDAERESWYAFREAIKAEQAKAAFLNQAKEQAEAAALAAYNAALQAQQSGHVQPPAPPQTLPPENLEATPPADPTHLLDLGLAHQSARPLSPKAAAAGGLGILALLLL